MTDPAPALAPAPAPSAAPTGVTALGGNRAALTLLAVQALGAPLLMLQFGLDAVTAFLISITVNVLLLLTVFGREFAALRADSRWRTPPNWSLALAVFIVVFIASRAWSAVALSFFPQLPSADTVQVLTGAGSAAWLLVLTGGVLVPIIEEIAFRGLMLRGHERAAGFTVAALTTSAAFALAHGAPVSVIGILPLAYVLARLAQHTGSLWDPVIVHVLNNGLVLGLVVALGDRLPLDELSTAQSEGALESMGPAVGLGAAVLGAGLLWVLHLWLTPRVDPQNRAAPGPWLSGAYIIIILFGLVSAGATFPAVVDWVRAAVQALPPLPLPTR
ncbi:CPBP family intramembrane glutamic endopeptidase [Deinococcus radiophilus]|uniref:CPBP family intramembrane glutamic endopeptidase n=1 Tax=Deinococcus radiophilus TaxID=32062 RepID=UPI001E3C2E5B|nr:type II CAAX endopeptidase family protein [Deinococcus radiophilus]UFA50846.1 CPBP family intramembrane metalloprotease [Deinococcus radiophilus]